ncbi:large extracellular alpha-helical protein [Saprospira grandis DSM 2844]|uniref:Large extracellular alpha-helical protein n=1 Tax=Saprospira grandis DSM 2844 TaxID=694433 RepID=J0NXD2_9BACT|nr:alpha-2-macroglobulin family protein [Saprospira grandis]EJF52144.1 large extracellular alpha-helical protein [Saprospira grandis DSM 2844]
MKRYPLWLLFSLLISTQMFSQNYEKAWLKIDSLDRQGLPESALKKTDSLLQIIRKAEAGPARTAHYVKGLLYYNKFQGSLEEDGLVKSIYRLEEEMQKAEGSEKALLQSMVAQLYHEYLSNHYYKFSDRSKVNELELKDIRTWDIERISEQAFALYWASLSDPAALELELKQFAPILSRTDFDADLQPTLYELLAQRALNFFENENSYLSQPAYQFYVESPTLFAVGQEFVGQKIESRDSFSHKWQTLKLYQKIVARSLERKSPLVLLQFELRRLKWTYSQSINEDKDALYLAALTALEEKYEEQAAVAEIIFAKATYYKQLGQGYSPSQPDPKARWALKVADSIATSIIADYPKSFGAKQAQSLKVELAQKHLKLRIERYLPLNQAGLIRLDYKNLSQVHLRLIKLSESELERFQNIRYEYQEQIDFLAKRDPVYRQSHQLIDSGDFQRHGTELMIPAQTDPGIYVVQLSANADFSYAKNANSIAVVQLTNLGLIQRQEKGLYEFIVVNRWTGEPQKGVKVEFREQQYNRLSKKYNWKRLKSVLTDGMGYALSKNVKRDDYYSYNIRVEKGKDFLLPESSFSNYDYEKPRENGSTEIRFFSDRAIYRPGQTIYFKGIALYSKGEQYKVVKNQEYAISLFDVNGQKLEELRLTTNEYGSLQGSFTAPTTGLMGQMSIRNTSLGYYSSHSIRVEEYKRPKFEVNFLPQEEAYKLNDQVTVLAQAEALAGPAISEAKFSYRVVREVRFPYWRYWGWNPWLGQSQEITKGEGITDEKGVAKIDFEAIPDKSISLDKQPVFNYTVYVDVTDINGETRSSQTAVRVGAIALDLSVNLKSELDQGQKLGKLKLNSRNLNGGFEPALLELSWERLEEPKNIYVKRQWEQPDYYSLGEQEFKAAFPHIAYKQEDKSRNWKVIKTQAKNKINTAEQKEIDLQKLLKKWPAGYYRLSVKTTDKYGQEIQLEREFRLFNSQTKKANVQDILFANQKSFTVEPGETIEFALASATDFPVLFERDQKGKGISQRNWLQLGEKWNKQSYTVQEDDRGNLYFRLIGLRYNRNFSQRINVYVPHSNKKLNIELSTFRDKLQPGQEERWELKITGPDKAAAEAELVASLYDASLDALVSHNWGLSLYGSYYGSSNWSTNCMSVEHASLVAAQDWNLSYSYPSHKWSSLNWQGFSFYDWGFSPRRMYKSHSRATGRAEKKEVQVLGEATMEEVMIDDTAGKAAPPPAPIADSGFAEAPEEPSDKDAGDLGDVKVRTNLNETVFFFPQLRTDKEGNVILSFTMNEALTRWRLMLLAHTQDLKVGQKEAFVQTQKDLMVVPNAPRFFRQGDKMEFSAKINSLVDKQLEGEAQLLLFDAYSMQAIDAEWANKNNRQSFSLKAKGATALSWKLEIPSNWTTPVVHRIVAKAGQFSDGEESSLPVLSNRMLVTESMPLPVRGKTDKNFEFKRMQELSKSNTLEHYSYTLEFTPNPAWYAVQSLPYLMEYPHECSEQLFSRYYANSLAANVANSHPKIKRVFEAWKTAGSKALESNLSKNQELKNALLEETPWVLQAQSEAQQKKHLGVLFDLNRMGQEQKQALRKLADRQLGNGGFPWFPGGRDSWYISQYIVEGMGHLQVMGVAQENEPMSQDMIIKAVRYIDNQLLDQYDRLLATAKRQEDPEAYLKKDHLGYMAIHYFYARSFFPKVELKNRRLREARAYYTGQMQTYALKKSIYMQGMIALALHRDENLPKVQEQIIKSLKERALKSEEMGMYWQSPHGYFWYELPIERHCLMIELFDEVANDQETVEALKTWLLKAKQTTHWKTTKATAAACYALLARGENYLVDSQPVDIKLGGELLDQKALNPEAGTGYIKKRWSAKEIEPKMAQVEIKNPNASVAWGAIYWQYFEQLDKIESFEETPLQLKKQLFKQVKGDRGLELQPITAEKGLEVGDLVMVRIELRVDRDMEYVHLKDQRAAAFEPTNVLSQYKYQGGLGYYESTKDAATHFFFSYLSKGTYVFEYPVRVAQKGDFSNGISSIQCMYAPEFSSHSQGIRLEVK